jgi:hypothetical protein
MRRETKFRFASSALARLPARLRVLVGCAEVLQGGVAGCDLVEIDLEKSRVRMINCDNMDAPVPFVTERITVDLARLKVFADRPEPEAKPIYFISRYLPHDDAGLDGRKAFETALAATGLFDPGKTEPKWVEVQAAIAAVGAQCLL